MSDPNTAPDDDFATSSPSTSPSDAEQDARDRRIWWMLVALGAVIVVGIMLLLRPVIVARLNAAKQLDQASILITNADDGVSAVDSILRGDLSTDTADAAHKIGPRLTSTRATLQKAVALVDDAFPHITDDEQHRATLVRATGTTRIAMLDAAPAILSAIAKAGDAAAPAGDAWQRTLDASAVEKQAVASYNLKTNAGVQQAAGLAGQVEDAYTSARAEMLRAATAFPEAGLSDHVAYIDQRLRQLAILKEATAAWLVGDVGRANGLVAAYNREQVVSAALARKLPATPAQQIAEAYKRLTAPALAKYEAARAQEAQADRELKGL